MDGRSDELIAYVRKRVFSLIFVLIGISIISFIISNISPVDPAEAYVRRNVKTASEEQIEHIRKEMGLDLPLYQQYFRWIVKAVKLDFGKSFVTNNPVIIDVSNTFPATLLLVSITMLIVILTAIPIGVFCAIYKNTVFDNTIRIITLLSVSVPSFWFGFVLLYYFAVKFKLVPVVGYGEFKNVILPAITLSIPLTASNIRVLRANMLENMNEDFVVYAQARGMSENRIVFKHVLKNAIPPIISLLGQSVGFVIAGAAIVEKVFSWPGIGNYVVDAIVARDLPVINAYVLIMAVIVVLCNLIGDVVNIYMNPKILKESGNL